MSESWRQLDQKEIIQDGDLVAIPACHGIGSTIMGEVNVDEDICVLRRRPIKRKRSSLMKLVRSIATVNRHVVITFCGDDLVKVAIAGQQVHICKEASLKDYLGFMALELNGRSHE
jgi:hypothetical protein